MRCKLRVGESGRWVKKGQKGEESLFSITSWDREGEKDKT